MELLTEPDSGKYQEYGSPMTDAAAPAQRTILIVDDIEDNRAILDRHLKRAGFATRTCADGMEAIRLISSNPLPDLVLLDWMMPGISGLETLKTIRERYDANTLPVIMCTALGEESSVVVAIKEGANDFVMKPINFPILLARLKSQLLRKEAMATLQRENSDLEDTLVRRTRDLLASQRPADDGGG
ncbi:MAG: response regulator transcription factor [Hyphomicrobium sp.]